MVYPFRKGLQQIVMYFVLMLIVLGISFVIILHLKGFGIDEIRNIGKKFELSGVSATYKEGWLECSKGITGNVNYDGFTITLSMAPKLENEMEIYAVLDMEDELILGSVENDNVIKIPADNVKVTFDNPGINSPTKTIRISFWRKSDCVKNYIRNVNSNQNLYQDRYFGLIDQCAKYYLGTNSFEINVDELCYAVDGWQLNGSYEGYVYFILFKDGESYPLRVKLLNVQKSTVAGIDYYLFEIQVDARINETTQEWKSCGCFPNRIDYNPMAISPAECDAPDEHDPTIGRDYVITIEGIDFVNKIVTLTARGAWQ